MPYSRHSCDELMSRSYNLPSAADVCVCDDDDDEECGGGGEGQGAEGANTTCRRCLLDKLSNKGLSLESGGDRDEIIRSSR